MCADVEIIGHEDGESKGTFLCRTEAGKDCRVSGTSMGIVNQWRKEKPKKMEISFMYWTDDGKPFQPVFEKFID
jgi:hypothetical protein